MKILVSIGTMQGHHFTRLLKIIDDLCDQGVLDGKEVTAQIGDDSYKPRNYKAFSLITDAEFKRLIDEADLVICHAGTGTVTSSIKKGKKVIVFPRLAKFGEHYDDHQLDLSKAFKDAGYVECAMNEEELREKIKNISSFTPTPFVSQNKKINDIIISYIDGNGNA